jgi:hypothetical protein
MYNGRMKKNGYIYKVSWTYNEDDLEDPYGQGLDFFMQDFAGDLTAYPVDDDWEIIADGTRVGRVTGYHFNTNIMLNQGYSLMQILDHASRDASFMMSMVDEDKNNFHSSLQRENEDIAFSSNVLYLDRIGIHPDWRGQGLGYDLTRITVLRHAYETPLIVGKPGPFIVTDEMEFDQIEHGSPELERAAALQMGDFYVDRYGFRWWGDQKEIVYAFVSDFFPDNDNQSM